MPPEREDDDDGKEKQGFWSKVKGFFGGADEEERLYNRRLIDNRIDRYLDENFDSYIDEYGLIREGDLLKYDERYDDMVERIDGLKSFVRITDADLGNLETRVDALKKKSRKRRGK